MRTLNKAILIGNLGADPEIRVTSQGQRVAHLSVATERRWTDGTGEVQKRTEWHRVVAWGRVEEVAEQFLTRGERVYIEGEIQYRSYEDAEGTTRHITEISARELIMLGRREAPPHEAEADREPDAGTAPEPQPAADTPSRRRHARGRGGEAAPVPPAKDDLPF